MSDRSQAFEQRGASGCGMLDAMWHWTKNLVRVPDRPRGRDLPRALLAVAVQGALFGPFFAALQTLVLELPFPPPHRWARWLAYACGIGAAFATTFYVTCGLPQHHIERYIGHYGSGIQKAIRAGLAVLGAVLGFGIVSFLLGRLVGFSMIGERLSLAITIVIALLITAFLGLAGELHRERELRQRVAAEAAARAQVAALQAQINPHFFFNTLNTLSALVDTDPGRARNLIQSLAGMFRYSLACSQNGLARLEDEVRFVEDYLALEKARLGERLQVTWTAARDLAGVRVPGLALQPLVENAVRHGIARRLAPGRLEISVSREAGAVRLRVSNETEPSDGAPDLSETRLFQDGHALSILRRRLAAEYGERAALRLWAEAPERVVAELTIPAAAGEAAAR